MDELASVISINSAQGAAMSERARLKATIAGAIAAGICTPTSESRNGRHPLEVAAYAAEVAEAILCECGL